MRELWVCVGVCAYNVSMYASVRVCVCVVCTHDLLMPTDGVCITQVECDSGFSLTAGGVFQCLSNGTFIGSALCA